MKGKKNLERAIILGLILSTGVYGSAWAEITGQITTVRPGSEDLIGKVNNYIEYKEITGNSDKNGFDSAISVSSNGEGGQYHSVDHTFNFKGKNEIDESLKIDIVHEKYGNGNNFLAGVMTNGYNKDITANLTINSEGSISINAKSENDSSVLGVWAKSDDKITIKNNIGDITIDVIKESGINKSYIANPSEEEKTLHAVYGLNASKDPNKDKTVDKGSSINITADKGSITVTAKSNSTDLKDSYVYAAANDNGNIILKAADNISLESYANNNNNAYGLDTWAGKENSLEADKINVYAKTEGGDAYAINVDNGSIENRLKAEESNVIKAESENGNAYAVSVKKGSKVNIASDKNNYISAYVNNSDKESVAIKADGVDSIVLVAGKENYINSSEDSYYAGSINGLAISAENSAYVDIKSEVDGITKIGGAVYAKDSNTIVSIVGKNNNVKNNIYSAAVIENAGDLQNSNDEDMRKLNVVSALYAEDGATINLSGINNIQTYYADPSDEGTSERAVWAYDKANINIDGYTYISTYDYENSPNSMDIAIAAGTATNLDKDDFTDDALNAAGLANVKLNYENYNGYKSQVKGDILSAYAGRVNIDAKDTTSGIDITGNLLAGNNGVLNVDLGNGGILTGRADDYGDAGVIIDSGHGTTENQHDETFFDPAFSSDIIKGGQVNLTMGENSRWNVTGQSWITSIDTEKSSNAVIDLISANTDRNETAHALTVYKFNGDAIFNMSLDANRAVSDMLYMREANGDYIINVVDPVTVADMYAGGLNGLRFATVGSGRATFKAVTLEQGAFNLEYAVDTDNYANNEENIHYNGDEMNHYKPGDSMVDGFFDKNNDAEPGAPIEKSGKSVATKSANIDYGVMLLDENNETENAEVTANSEEEKFEGVKNIKLTGISNAELSSAGKAILNMSRANYSNAIYMDRLNKRLGEARYINSEDGEGMWVRIRHDRIGKTDAYRSQNTMYELGYDVKQECDNGERRVGMAIDYMHGDTGYSDIAGKGEIDRYGLWLYDTWMGDKGHYADYVVKWGHLDNDFEIYAPITGEKIDGDYSNNVFSVSAEYGKKNDMGNGWYIEPQIQAQLARVTGADYVTSQDTKVSVDGINSLIGRAGFRIGKDFGEEKQSTVYIKADVLHEFLGDQDISVMDGTTNGEWAGISYENEGTWYDVGFGFATQMSKNSYAFMDFEKSFGNDNDETYQINVGMQWSF